MAWVVHPLPPQIAVAQVMPLRQSLAFKQSEFRKKTINFSYLIDSGTILLRDLFCEIPLRRKFACFTLAPFFCTAKSVGNIGSITLCLFARSVIGTIDSGTNYFSKIFY
ncbi:hypothetical protein [Microbulbifer marinus]|uniref:hypothetical protein n=1 Tax=Microbulbifer marinus TaxID=658218 RepID=UPI0011153D63|nr:hypothetical protein [Microbulbifer marinus]